MDPQATLERWRDAVASRDRGAAKEAWCDLANWISKGGFEPQWTAEEREAFSSWRP